MDMITLAMAKAYADPVVIDLTKYVGTVLENGEQISFNDAILALFPDGGGSVTLTDISSFWEDVDTDRPMRFVIDAGSLSPGVTIEAGTNSTTMLGSIPHAIEFSFFVNLGAWSRATVVLGDNFDGTTKILVAAEPITIPGA